jgi:hypothetical protein
VSQDLFSPVSTFRDEEDYNLLHYAAGSLQWPEDKLIQLVDLLLEVGLSVATYSTRNESPVAIALVMGNFAVALYLLGRKGEQLQGKDLHTECKEAIKAGAWEIFGILFALEARTENHTALLQEFLLYHCSLPRFFHQVAGTERLVLEGFVLFQALQTDYVACRENGSQSTILMKAITAGHDDILRELLITLRNHLPLMHYLAFGLHGLPTISAMKYILGAFNPSFLNLTNKVGQTPLHLAVCGGVVENVSFLISRRATLRMADIRGYTPLRLATDDYAAVGSRGFDTGFEILSELLKSEEAEDKETLDYQDQWGRTALMHAARKHIAWNDGSQVDANRRPIALAIRFLLKKGVSVSVIDNSAKMPCIILKVVELRISRRGACCMMVFQRSDFTDANSSGPSKGSC